MSTLGGDAPGASDPLWAADVAWDSLRSPAPEPSVPAVPAAPAAPRPVPAPRYRRRRWSAFLVVLVLVASVMAAQRSLDHAAHGVPVAGVHVPSAPISRAGASTAQAPRPPLEGAPLHAGDSGERVVELQAALGELGYGGDPDGGFGPTTHAAVARFQRSQDLPADGVAGLTTATAIRGALVRAAGHDAADTLSGVAVARRRGRLSPALATVVDTAVDTAVAEVGRVRIGPAAALTAVLHDIAGQADSLDAPRARALGGMLDANVRRFRSGGMPASLATLEGSDGVVYRYFPGHGYQFHPLASFAALDAAVTAGRSDDARRIADAMLARAVPEGGALVWEYYFPFGGPDRWTSGFAQAAGADSLARAGKMLGDVRIAHAARAAFASIPAAYLHPIAGGSWIREYSFSTMLILNAQLQTFLLLSDYARTSGDANGRVVAGRMKTAARRLLPRFDTGCWSRYSLGGAPASRHYHTYHIGLLRRIAALTGDRSWAVVAARWEGYLRRGGCPSA